MTDPLTGLEQLKRGSQDYSDPMKDFNRYRSNSTEVDARRAGRDRTTTMTPGELRRLQQQAGVPTD